MGQPNKRFTFFVKEYDSQASITKYYKIHTYGHNSKQAFDCTSLPVQEDYDYTLLTLNQFNALKKKPNPWELLKLLWPFWIKY